MANTKTSRLLLSSAARTVATASKVQQDEHARGVRLYLTITVAVAGTGGLQVVVRGYDRAPGAGVATGQSGVVYAGVPVVLTGPGTAQTTTGTYVYEMSPYGGIVRTNVLAATVAALPWAWDAEVLVGDATSYTYSLSAETF
jgi:hypothetical protein